VLPRLRSLRFIALLDSLIQRLKHSRVYGGDYINCRIKFLFGHARFPCVRKAAVNSRIAESHHRNRQTDEHFLALGEALHRMRISIKGSKVSFLGCHDLPF
jgi:hypothetical protein